MDALPPIPILPLMPPMPLRVQWVFNAKFYDSSQIASEQAQTINIPVSNKLLEVIERIVKNRPEFKLHFVFVSAIRQDPPNRIDIPKEYRTLGAEALEPLLPKYLITYEINAVLTKTPGNFTWWFDKGIAGAWYQNSDEREYPSWERFCMANTSNECQDKGCSFDMNFKSMNPNEEETQSKTIIKIPILLVFQHREIEKYQIYLTRSDIATALHDAKHLSLTKTVEMRDEQDYSNTKAEMRRWYADQCESWVASTVQYQIRSKTRCWSLVGFAIRFLIENGYYSFKSKKACTVRSDDMELAPWKLFWSFDTERNGLHLSRVHEQCHQCR